MEEERLKELEAKNKAFLDQSWANIIENEEVEQRLLQEMESEDLPETHMNELFQIAQKSKPRRKSSVKLNYATRGKTGQTKIVK